MDAQAADVWLLTEVHRDWDPRRGRFVVSPARGGAPEWKRWAGVETTLPLGKLSISADPEHAGEEGLCLARVEIGGDVPSVLVACSVLPWRGAGKYWPGLPVGQVDEFLHVLEHHVSRIAAERQPDEPLIWGGDFNQPLVPPYWSTSARGATALREAFDALGLVALTEHAAHLNGASFAIDHLAVSRELLPAESVAVHRPEWDGGQLSDHAAYTADLRLQTHTDLPEADERSATQGRGRRCPRCGQLGALPVVYGLVIPDPDAPAGAEEVIYAGCVLMDDSPDYACRPCAQTLGLV